jgi:hypothetical protein
MKQSVSDTFHMDNEQVVVVTPPTPIHRHIKPEPVIPEKKVRFLYVGSNAAHKNIRTLIEGFRHLYLLQIEPMHMKYVKMQLFILILCHR